MGGYIITNKKYSNEIERQIVDEYLNGASTKYLKDKYNFKTNKSIIDKVKKYGENPRTQREELMLNKTYEEFSMSIIDSWFKAYYLGLIIADGYIVNNVVGIDMVDEDEINKTTMYQLRSSLKRNINILKVLVYDQPYGMQRKYNLIHDKPSETIMEDTLY